ncbi:MAG: flagellar protein FlgN [Lachnospiraceae bacterium]|nr:flagellar protein FlgN [Lachnospiraceae bacterium]
MENLIDVLTRTCDTYDGLLELSRKKTPVIITGNLEELSRITEEEQEYASRLQNLDRSREVAMKDIANVLNKKADTLTLTVLIQILSGRPGERDALVAVRDRLQKVVYALRQVNEQNSELLKESIELVQVEMNLLQSMRTAPEMANYSRGAYNTGETMGVARGNFDAKQ